MTIWFPACIYAWWERKLDVFWVMPLRDMSHVKGPVASVIVGLLRVTPFVTCVVTYSDVAWGWKKAMGKVSHWLATCCGLLWENLFKLVAFWFPSRNRWLTGELWSWCARFMGLDLCKFFFELNMAVTYKIHCGLVYGSTWAVCLLPYPITQVAFDRNPISQALASRSFEICYRLRRLRAFPHKVYTMSRSRICYSIEIVQNEFFCVHPFEVGVNFHKSFKLVVQFY